MTNEQREKITDLRHQGLGYTAIANAVGLSKDSVKSFCRSHGLGGVMGIVSEEIAASPERCLHCGKPLVQRAGVKEKKFCDRMCRTAWWNAHQDQVNRKAVYKYTCAFCGHPFSAYGNAHRKYCSHACYIRDRFKGGDPV